MQAVSLDTPEGILAVLGWDPALVPGERVRRLARDIVARHRAIEPDEVRIDYEAPAQFGHHSQLEAFVAGELVPLRLKATSYRAASVVALAELSATIGIALADINPDEATLADIRRDAHFWEHASTPELVSHWSRVQAIRSADDRGERVPAKYVRIDPSRSRGWVPDRERHYDLTDISRDGFEIVLAYSTAES